MACSKAYFALEYVNRTTGRITWLLFGSALPRTVLRWAMQHKFVPVTGSPQFQAIYLEMQDDLERCADWLDARGFKPHFYTEAREWDQLP